MARTPRPAGVSIGYERRFLPTDRSAPAAIFACDAEGRPSFPADDASFNEYRRRATVDGTYTDTGAVAVMRRVLIVPKEPAP